LDWLGSSGAGDIGTFVLSSRRRSCLAPMSCGWDTLVFVA
jgi:hypothetical protein